MNEQEKLYRSLSVSGAAGMVLGIVVLVTGVAAGVLSIINGAKLLASRKHILL
ncbi:MAG: hypothetical protein Q4B01_08885 [Eubacteriales bacterium]|nr:hypothetical protein [Eubacteriales bacterium]